MILGIILALNLNPATASFDKLLCNKQTNPRAHGIAGREEGVKYLRQVVGCDSDTVILDGQNNSSGVLSASFTDTDRMPPASIE